MTTCYVTPTSSHYIKDHIMQLMSGAQLEGDQNAKIAGVLVSHKLRTIITLPNIKESRFLSLRRSRASDHCTTTRVLSNTI